MSQAVLGTGGVSVIMTVRNESGAIDALLDSLDRQTRRPDEIVVVDGGSSDDTLAKLNGYAPLREILEVISAPGANISRGRNLAVRAARHELLLVTDAGVALPDTWVERLAGALEQDPTVVMVGGFFESAPESTFEWALGATTLPQVDEIDPSTFMPSHRSVAFRRSTWDTVGGYPEWLDYCEDLLFDMRARAAGMTIGFEPAATVAFRPRSTLRAFALQYFRYARGDGKASILGLRHLIRYAVYLAAALLPITPAPLRSVAYPAAVALAAAYCRRPWQRLLTSRNRRSLPELLMACLMVPGLRLVGDLAKMVGYPVGVMLRRGTRPATTGEDRLR